MTSRRSFGMSAVFVFGIACGVFMLPGCTKERGSETIREEIVEPFDEEIEIATKDDGDRFLCMYFRCVETKQLYMQKYERRGPNKIYRPVGAFRLDDGVGAFPLDDLSLLEDGGEMIAADRIAGFDPCPYCENTSLCRCSCGKTFCGPNAEGVIVLTCPWCDEPKRVAPGTFDFDSGGG